MLNLGLKNFVILSYMFEGARYGVFCKLFKQILLVIVSLRSNKFIVLYQDTNILTLLKVATFIKNLQIHKKKYCITISCICVNLIYSHIGKFRNIAKICNNYLKPLFIKVELFTVYTEYMQNICICISDKKIIKIKKNRVE